jgi:hypothetical protein
MKRKGACARAAARSGWKRRIPRAARRKKTFKKIEKSLAIFFFV